MSIPVYFIREAPSKPRSYPMTEEEVISAVNNATNTTGWRIERWEVVELYGSFSYMKMRTYYVWEFMIEKYEV